MKRPTMLVEAVLHQASMDLDLSVERDAVTLRHRCKHEGFSFLTITLPVLSDSLERGLECGLFSCPTSFSRQGSLPRFLGGFFKRVFNKEGRLLPEPCPDSVYWIRQICRFMKKLKIGCTPDREIKAAKQFLAIEGELRDGTAIFDRQDRLLDQVAGILWSQVFPEIDPCSLVAHHGPGVTAERLRSNDRHRLRHWNSRSEFTFPSDLHCFPNYWEASMRSGCRTESTKKSDGPKFLKLPDEHPVRVVFVPKTQLAPRVIAIEPSHVQYMQQALKDYVYEVLERHPLTKHSIRFTRQDVNQKLAYQSSIDRRLATLDLKDASDRVHNALVNRIFKTSGILDYVQDSRSLHALLPTGENVVLSKFASMGSAMCFPVEAMVFYTLILTAMHSRDGRRPSSRSIAAYSRSIDIYGDDIIIPIDYTDDVVNYLESNLLKVNVNKSFRDGNFRESCGGDFFMGVAVNPVYARTVPFDDSRRWTAEEVMSWNATADLFYLRGSWHVAQVIRDLLAKVVGSPIPRTRQPGAGVVHLSFLFDTNLHWEEQYHGWKQKRLHFTPVKTKDEIDGNELACLNKWGIQTVLREIERISAPGDTLYSDRARVLSEYAELLDRRNDRSRSSGLIGASPEDLLQPLQQPLPAIRDSSPIVCDMVTVVDEEIFGDPWHEDGLSYRGDCSLVRCRSFFDLLREEGSETDFMFSTKRGGFKSRRRWVSLVS